MLFHWQGNNTPFARHIESSLRLLLDRIRLTFRKKMPSRDFGCTRRQYVISSIDNSNNDNHNTIQLQQCYSGAIIRESSMRCARMHTMAITS